jgi:polyisoprenoid-binding protein YceI
MVTVTGKLTIHGVEQTRTIRGTITVDKLLKLSLNSEFDVKLVDHNIEVPKLVFHKIGEVINVKINSDYKMIN